MIKRKSRILSEEHKRKIGEALKGKKKTFSPLAVENIRIAAAKRKGIPTGPCTEGRRNAISNAKKGVPVPLERRERIRSTLTGRKNPEHSLRMKGRIPPNKGKLYGIGRNSGRYKIWRDAVLERDGIKCVKCNSTNRLLVHHKVKWKDDETLRFDIDNGETLCNRCHSKEEGLPEEFRDKEQMFKKGHKHSEEVLRKISASKKAKSKVF